MSVEINRVRVAAGRVRFEVECDNIDHFARIANEIMLYDHSGFVPSPVEVRRKIVEGITGAVIPRASVPPFVDFAEQPYPGGYMTADDELPLRNGEAIKAGGSD